MIKNANFSDIEPIVEYMKSVPFDVSRTRLYSAKELYEGYNPELPETYFSCYDQLTYKHYISENKLTNNIKESIARTLHDQGIYVALGEFFRAHNYLKCIGVMGGHALLRTDKMYRQIVFLSKQLTEQGFFMLSGGGPGAMEATHVGAWMAGRNKDEVEDALHTLSAVPSFNKDKNNAWLSTAFKVIDKYPQVKYESLGIPTWLYGHEPSTPFATHIAKFFENSLRENNILTLPFGGIIYTHGSAGTMHEIFRDAEQNHYLSYGISSPMIFLGTKFWTEDMPAYPLLKQLAEKGKYKNLSLTLTDDSEMVKQQLFGFQDMAKAHPEAFALY